jgi:hypothetical protein
MLPPDVTMDWIIEKNVFATEAQRHGVDIILSIFFTSINDIYEITLSWFVYE